MAINNFGVQCKKIFAVVAVIFIALNDANALDQKKAGAISITDAYVYVPVGSSQNTMAFFTIKNNTEDDVTLSKVTSAHVKNIAMFPAPTATVKKNTSTKPVTGGVAADVAAEQQEDRWTIRAGESLKLRPDNQYLQLTGLKISLTTGDELQLEVSTSSGKKIAVIARAKSAFDQAHGH